MKNSRNIPTAMTIAGSDFGGGAGIQADLKTFAAMGVYGTSALTAITAQNTHGVTDALELPASMVRSQIDAIVTDIGADAVKTGMLSSSDIIEAVTGKLVEHGLTTLVVDPVMVAKSGDRLLREQAVDVLRTMLVPLATVVTPNAPEAEVLTGRKIASFDDARRAARALVEELGAGSAVVKGGHLEGPATDVLFQAGEFIEFTRPRLKTKNSHGTGCTFASATAAGLARGMSVTEAVRGAKEYVTAAIKAAFPMGGGHGPLNHFYQLWGDSGRSGAACAAQGSAGRPRLFGVVPPAVATLLRRGATFELPAIPMGRGCTPLIFHFPSACSNFFALYNPGPHAQRLQPSPPRGGCLGAGV